MSIQGLSENMNIIQSLVIPGLDDDMDIIQKLDDEPNDVGGLTAAELKAEFDKAGNIIKEYLNGTLLPAISNTTAEEDARAQAEAQRVSAESARVQAENARQSAEASRASAETARAQAESARASAETARAQAESGRVSAEQGRVAAEESRVSAETAREQAEEQRESATQGIVAQATAQANIASQSAAQANSDKQYTSVSASLASSAAYSAQQSSVTSQSWAAGGTGTREGEDTNNAKYWAQVAQAGGSGTGYVIGDGLKVDLDTNTLSVNTANTVQDGNQNPVTSDAVYQVVGDINTALDSLNGEVV